MNHPVADESSRAFGQRWVLFNQGKSADRPAMEGIEDPNDPFVLKNKDILQSLGGKNRNTRTNKK
jgi:hypothetical protein